jgi:hypothetical protein
MFDKVTAFLKKIFSSKKKKETIPDNLEEELSEDFGKELEEIDWFPQTSLAYPVSWDKYSVNIKKPDGSQHTKEYPASSNYREICNEVEGIDISEFNLSAKEEGRSEYVSKNDSLEDEECKIDISNFEDLTE